MGGTTGMIIMGLVVLVVLIFIIVSSITGKKARKKEQEKRKKVVKDEIKSYLSKVQNQKNISLEFEKVFSRKGPEYRYRDVFDVVVRILSPKDNKVLETKSFEIEGMTKKVSKKEYKTDWIVNSETDLVETQKRIAVAEKKVKLTKAEKTEIKKQEKNVMRDQRIEERKTYEIKKEENKKDKKDKSTMRFYTKKIEDTNKGIITKFIPERNK